MRGKKKREEIKFEKKEEMTVEEIAETKQKDPTILQPQKISLFLFFSVFIMDFT